LADYVAVKTVDWNKMCVAFYIKKILYIRTIRKHRFV